MSKILNLTNGDCAVDIMKRAGIPGAFLPWRDVLHEGPVPENLSLEELSVVRAEYIAGLGWGDVEKKTNSFMERDNMLKSYCDYEKVILWFEHDLYDQLQMLQIMDWLQENRCEETTLSLICTDQYLGMLTPDEMATLFKYEVPIADAQFDLAKRSWAAFREKSPEKWCALLQEDTCVLRFLEGAIVRTLEEFPNQGNGLSRTEQQALMIIHEGENCPGRIFGRNQELEERIFIGDFSFWNVLRGFLDSSPPLLQLTKGKKLALPANPDQKLTITSKGTEVLTGKWNWLEMKKLDRWIGGVHLTQNNAWIWDSADGIEIVRA